MMREDRSILTVRLTGVSHFGAVKVPILMRHGDSGLGVRINLVSSIINLIWRVISRTKGQCLRRYRRSRLLSSFLDAEPNEDTDNRYEDCASDLLVRLSLRALISRLTAAPTMIPVRERPPPMTCQLY